jgi:hypothetical protein
VSSFDDFDPEQFVGSTQVIWMPCVLYTFFLIPFYFQSVPVHSANCVKPYTVACRRVLSSAPL